MPLERLAARLRTSLQAVARKAGAGFLTWKSGLWEEVAFWDEWLETRGADWPGAFDRRCDPQRPLEPHLAELIDLPDGAAVRILDVGAGPLTSIGKTWAGRTIEITAVDPLARQYDRLLKKHRVVPPVRTKLGFAERLRDIFPANEFDLVHARNCLDHSYDPLRAFRQMIEVARPGACVYMDHAVNEADRQKHGGLHQWNFRQEEDEFIVAGASEATNVSRELAPLAEIECRVVDEKILVTMRKRTA